jgi:hypothetical protein
MGILMKISERLLGAVLAAGCLSAAGDAGASETSVSRATLGAYYFDGWAGKSPHAGKAEWAKDAPTHLTKRMLDEFPDREPVWGWRDDTPAVMERQIDLAADHGIAFFAFCWYHPDRTPEQFGACVKDAVAWMESNPEKATPEKLMLIYAWNEFGEGGYLAPTKGDPNGLFLRALARATTWSIRE